jgi:hypothetical protein
LDFQALPFERLIDETLWMNPKSHQFPGFLLLIPQHVTIQQILTEIMSEKKKIEIN